MSLKESEGTTKNQKNSTKDTQSLNDMIIVTHNFSLLNLFRITRRRLEQSIDQRDWDGRKEEERIGYVPEYYLTDEQIKERYL